MKHRITTLRLWAAIVALLAAGLGWPAGVAHATTFNFQAPSGSSPAVYSYFGGLSMYQDWVGVSAVAANFVDYAYQDQNGLGVVESPTLPATTDPRVNYQESLQFTFTKSVVLDGIDFTSLGLAPGSGAMVVVNGSIVFWTFGASLPGGNASNTGSDYLDLTGLSINQRIGAVVDIMAFDANDAFQVGSLSVEQVPGAPLPSSFGVGLAMFGCLGLVELVRRPSHRNRDHN